MTSAILPVIVIAFGVAVLPAQTQRGPSGSSGSSGTRIMSPTVVATWATRGNPVAGSERRLSPQTLALLVLWRGTPGWFSKGTGRSQSSGGSVTTFATTVRYGDLALDLSLDYQSRKAQVQGKEVALGDANDPRRSRGRPRRTAGRQDAVDRRADHGTAASSRANTGALPGDRVLPSV